MDPVVLRRSICKVWGAGCFLGFFGNNPGLFRWLLCLLNTESQQLFCADCLVSVHLFQIVRKLIRARKTGEGKKEVKQWLSPAERHQAQQWHADISQKLGALSSKSLLTSQSLQGCVKREWAGVSCIGSSHEPASLLTVATRKVQTPGVVQTVAPAV